MSTLQEFRTRFGHEGHAALARWAADCAGHVLPLFEAERPGDHRPRQALATLAEWIATGKFRMSVIRSASLAAHNAANHARDESPAQFAARAVGQAVATAHVQTHAVGAALYAQKAVIATNPADVRAAVAEERAWQDARVPDELREWVAAELKEKQKLLPKSLRTY